MWFIPYDYVHEQSKHIGILNACVDLHKRNQGFKYPSANQQKYC